MFRKLTSEFFLYMYMHIICMTYLAFPKLYHQQLHFQQFILLSILLREVNFQHPHSIDKKSDTGFLFNS